MATSSWYVHCFKCQKFPSAENGPLHLSSCSHIVCSACLKRRPDRCPKCYAHSKFQQLSSSMQDAYLRPFTQNIGRIQKVMQFQDEIFLQRYNLLSHKMRKYQEKLIEKQKVLDRLKSLYKGLKQELMRDSPSVSSGRNARISNAFR